MPRLRALIPSGASVCRKLAVSWLPLHTVMDCWALALESDGCCQDCVLWVCMRVCHLFIKLRSSDSADRPSQISRRSMLVHRSEGSVTVSLCLRAKRGLCQSPLPDSNLSSRKIEWKKTQTQCINTLHILTFALVA